MPFGITDFLDARELATFIWVFVLVLVVFLAPAMRPHLRSVLKAMTPWKVWVPLLLYGVYFAAVVFLLWRLDVWDFGLSGTTVIWFFASGITLVVRTVTEAAKQQHFFRRQVHTMVGLTVVLEFFVNTKTFSLPVELVLIPVLVFLSSLRVVAFHKTKTRKIGEIVSFMLGAIAIFMMGATLNEFFRFDQFQWLDVIRGLLVPIVFGLSTLPFAYVFALMAGFESLNSRLRIFSRGRAKPPLSVHLGLVSALGGDLADINKFAGQRGYEAVRCTTFREARDVVKDFREAQVVRESNREAARQRLDSMAGVSGEDDNGRQLDRREFAETKKALQWLHLCMMGHYRNLGVYRRNILEILGSFEKKDLSDPHGIVLKLRGDEQAWYAYRRLPSGYCLGIGANGPPNSQWLYAKPHPPSGFPSSKAEGWTDNLSVGVSAEWKAEPET